METRISNPNTSVKRWTFRLPASQVFTTKFYDRITVAASDLQGQTSSLYCRPHPCSQISTPSYCALAAIWSLSC